MPADNDNKSDIGQTHLFTGRELDYETYLQPNRYRFHSPLLGRWLTRDPIEYEDGPNLYEYLRGNPAAGQDPMGQVGMREPHPPISLIDPRENFPTYPGAPPGTFPYNYAHYFTPGPSHSAPADPWYLNWGQEMGLGGAIAAIGGIGAIEAGMVSNVVLFGGGVTSLGVGSTAVVAPGLGAGTYPALLIDGTVYVARFHVLAAELAGGSAVISGRVQKYGIVTIDACGKVLGWM